MGLNWENPVLDPLGLVLSTSVDYVFTKFEQLTLTVNIINSGIFTGTFIQNLPKIFSKKFGITCHNICCKTFEAFDNPVKLFSNFYQ